MCSQTFIAFLRSSENFVHFEKKDQPHTLNISEVIDSEKCGYLNARKLLFQNTFKSQRIRESQRVLRSERHHFYPNFPLIQDKLS